jgi:hypothetical protein
MLKRIEQNSTLIIQAWSVISVIILLLSINSSLYYGLDSKHCDGNLIIPSYTVQDFKSSQENLNSRYSLIRHHENNTHIPGYPVLFLPGNAGNYKQVRTLGSVAQRIRNWNFNGKILPLQLYAIDTKEELTAFETQSIRSQAFFAIEAIEFILKQYKIKDLGYLPTSVFVIGHSMGGIVAREIFLLPSYKKDRILNLVTLSTPHLEPPAALDRYMNDLYTRLNQYWLLNSLKGGTLENLFMISIAGGNRDRMVDAGLTKTSKISYQNNTLHVHSTGAKHIWTSTDHEGAVWCDQILHAVSDLLFKFFTAETKTTIETRMATAVELFVNSHLPHNQNPIKFDRYDINVYSNENSLQLPQVQTYEDETRRYILKLVDIPGIRFQLLTDLPTSKINIYLCKETNEFTCISTDAFFNLPFPYQEFTMLFKNWTTTSDEVRKEWLGTKILEQDLKGYDVVLIEIQPLSAGFLFADINLVQANTKTYDNYKICIFILISDSWKRMGQNRAYFGVNYFKIS